MASSADNSVALRVMAESNSDFLAFIQNLRAFLQGMDPVTFNVGSGITVNSLMKLINDYRNGVFTEIVLGGASSGTQVRLSVDPSGNLRVSDLSGEHLAVIDCERIRSSSIVDCEVGKVTASGARIENLKGTVAITGGNVRLRSLNAGSLMVGNLKGSVVSASQLSVSAGLQCNGLLSYGARKFVPSVMHSLFYRNGAPLNNAATLMKFHGDDWDMTSTPNSLVPSDLGFGDITAQGALACFSVPDLVRIMGNNKYDDFQHFHNSVANPLFQVSGVPMANPTNVSVFTISGPNVIVVPLAYHTYEMAAMMAWPCGGYGLNSSYGYVCLASFAQSDSGKEIYYETLSEPWKIYRVLKVTYGTGSTTAEFGELVTLSPYTCTRFIARIHDSSVEQPSFTGPRTVVYSLEYA